MSQFGRLFRTIWPTRDMTCACDQSMYLTWMEHDQSLLGVGWRQFVAFPSDPRILESENDRYRRKQKEWKNTNSRDKKVRRQHILHTYQGSTVDFGIIFEGRSVELGVLGLSKTHFSRHPHPLDEWKGHLE